MARFMKIITVRRPASRVSAKITSSGSVGMSLGAVGPCDSSSFLMMSFIIFSLSPNVDRGKRKIRSEKRSTSFQGVMNITCSFYQIKVPHLRLDIWFIEVGRRPLISWLPGSSVCSHFSCICVTCSTITS